MLILIKDTERGMDVAKGIWGAFSSCLYIHAGYVDTGSLEYIIDSCAKSDVSLIIVAEKSMFIDNEIRELKNKNPHAICIYCDGGVIDASTVTMAFDKITPRDKIVQSIITYLKRKKLL